MPFLTTGTVIAKRTNVFALQFAISRLASQAARTLMRGSEEKEYNIAAQIELEAWQTRALTTKAVKFCMGGRFRSIDQMHLKCD